MSGPDLPAHCLPAEASLGEAAALVGRSPCPRIVLVDADGKAVGQVREEDLRLGLAGEARPHHRLDSLAGTLDPDLPVDAEGRPLGLPVTLQPTLAEALVMVGGRGSRLRPLTDDTPKPLLPVHGRPLLFRLLEQCARAGVRRAHLSLCYLGDRIREAVAAEGDLGLEIAYVEEDEPLGTAGALGLLPPLRSTLLVLNGDILSDICLPALAAWHARHDNLVTVATHLHEVHVPFGLAHSDGQRLRYIEEKPTLRLPVNAGIYLFEPELLAQVPKGRPWDMVTWLDELAGGGRLGIFPIVEAWDDIGSLERYRELGG